MGRNDIVIVTRTVDPHVDDVILEIERLGHEPVRLNTDEIPTDTQISLQCGGEDAMAEATIDILTSGRTLRSHAVRSVWWRRPSAFNLADGLSRRESEFAHGEIDHALNSLWASLECYWVSRPDAIRQASWKWEQLVRARRLGFDIPRTVITSSPVIAKEFFVACGRTMIFKVMTDPYLSAETVARKYPEEDIEPYEAPTTLLTEEDIDMLDSVQTAPCLFQERIDKKAELRITVIGNELFPALIHSQMNEETSLDWRQADIDVPFEVAQLPPLLAERCMKFVKSYGLNFSALDLVITPDDRYVFLENNPNGQFIFIESKLPELRMTQAMAQCLLEGGNDASSVPLLSPGRN